jgi:mycothiol synthase
VARAIDDADVPAVVTLINAATPATPIDETELRRWLTTPAQDIRFGLFERDGELVAYADVGLPDESPDRAWIDVRIPARLVVAELVDDVLTWSEQVARGDGRMLVRIFVDSGAPLAAHVERHGYRPIRASFQMRIELDDTPRSPVWPDGISVSAVRDGEERIAWEVSQEAFADHWEFTPSPWEEWSHFMLGEDFDRELWLLARDGDEVAGVCLCRPEAVGRPGVGWVRVLGVRRPWRRRGLGRALLLEAFHRFRSRGVLAVGLGVDGENTTGAVRLYESAGMWVEHRHDVYERSLG